MLTAYLFCGHRKISAPSINLRIDQAGVCRCAISILRGKRPGGRKAYAAVSVLTATLALDVIYQVAFTYVSNFCVLLLPSLLLKICLRLFSYCSGVRAIPIHFAPHDMYEDVATRFSFHTCNVLCTHRALFKALRRCV